MPAEFAAPRAEMNAELKAVRAGIASGLRDVEQRLTIRLGGMLALVTAILPAAKIFG
jgi:hypothetical protein